MKDIHNEAELNQFKFPNDRSPEEAELRNKLALKILTSFLDDDFIASRSEVRKRTVRAAYAWADAFLAHKDKEAVIHDT